MLLLLLHQLIPFIYSLLPTHLKSIFRKSPSTINPPLKSLKSLKSPQDWYDVSVNRNLWRGYAQFGSIWSAPSEPTDTDQESDHGDHHPHGTSGQGRRQESPATMPRAHRNQSRATPLSSTDPEEAFHPTVEILSSDTGGSSFDPQQQAQPASPPSEQDRQIRETFHFLQREAAQLGRPMEQDPRYWALKNLAYGVWTRRAQQPNQTDFSPQTGHSEFIHQQGLTFQHRAESHSQQAQYPIFFNSFQDSFTQRGPIITNVSSYIVEYPDSDLEEDEIAQSQTAIYGAEQSEESDSVMDINTDEAIILTLDRLSLKRHADADTSQLDRDHILALRQKRARISFLPGDAETGSAVYCSEIEEAPQGSPPEP